MTTTFRFVDLFCGGGGSITGAINALNAAGVTYEGRGFDHWELAVRTIERNHPEVVPDFKRACTPIECVTPDEIFDIDPGRIDFLWASPSCTHHSNAAGGKPRSNQLRSQPEHLLPYLRLTRCRRMFVENVKELREWGPVLDSETTYQGKRYKAGQADPRKKGLFFNGWLREIKASGYAVDMTVLNAADYGAATSRERLFIQAVRKSSGERIIWPEPTHCRTPGLFGLLPWRPAADIIDWSIRGESIFSRKKPLCANTLRRIGAGIRKYWGTTIEPLFIPQHTCGEVRPVTGPLSTIATTGSIGLVRPFLIEYYVSSTTAGVDIPLPTVTTKDRFGVIQGVQLPVPEGYRLDITHRMLTAMELAAATGFPDGYWFAGGETAAKKQIGNAVPPDLVSALYKAVLAA